MTGQHVLTWPEDGEMPLEMSSGILGTLPPALMLAEPVLTQSWCLHAGIS